MRYAIVSDIHANWPAWCVVRDDLLAQNVEAVVCLGDVIGYGPSPARVLADVREHCANVVLGNHDAAVAGKLDLAIFNDSARRAAEWTTAQLDDESRRWLGELPVIIEDDRCLFVHAEPIAPHHWGYVDTVADATTCFNATDKPLLFVGHTHRAGAFERRADGQVVELTTGYLDLDPAARYLINVGSVGDPRDDTSRACYCLFDLSAGRVELRKLPFDCKSLLRELRQHPELRLPRFLGQRDDQKIRAAPERAVTASIVANETVQPASKPAGIRVVYRQTTVVVDAPKPVPPPPPPNRRRRLAMLISLLIVLVGVPLLVKFLRQPSAPPPAPTPAPAPAPPPAPPPPPPVVGILPEMDGRLVLKAGKAKLDGKELHIETKYDDTPNIGFWQTPGESASWLVTVGNGGNYEVTLTYSLPRTVANFELSSGDSKFTGRPKPTGDWKKYQTEKIGTLHVGPGTVTVEIKHAGPNKGPLMNLRSITLAPK